MRILITGGAGFIGSHVAEAAQAAGHAIAIVDNLTTGRFDYVPAGATFVPGDVRDADRLRIAFEGFRPEAVVHLAAQASVAISVKDPAEDASVNILGTLEVLNACVAFGVKKVLVASSAGTVYGDVPWGTHVDVSAPLKPVSPYAVSKTAMEHYVTAYRARHGLDTTILRLANIFGPRQDPLGEAGVVAIFTHALLQGIPVRLFGRQAPGDGGCARDYLFIRDAVRVLLAVATGETSEPVMNVASGESLTTRQVLDRIAATLGVTSTVDDAPPRDGDLPWVGLQPGPGLWPADKKPTSFGDGLQETATWFRSQDGVGSGRR